MRMISKNVYFITGIDTDAGKSIVTGVLARDMRARGERVITQKFIQTGNTSISEDIELHRRIMGISAATRRPRRHHLPDYLYLPRLTATGRRDRQPGDRPVAGGKEYG